MIASGIGVTPLRALLEELPYQPGTATLLYRARTNPDLIFRQELDALARERGISVVYLLGARIPGRVSWLPANAAAWSDGAALRHLAPGLLDSDVFVCGPEPWMDAVRAAALASGLPSDQLHEERFAW